jgi:integrase/recombinase XerD
VKQTVLNDLPEWAARDINSLPTLRQATFRRFLRDMKLQGYSSSTVENYIKMIRTFNGGKKPFEQFTGEDLKLWMEQIGSNGWDEGFTNLLRIEAKHFFRWVHGCRSPRDKAPEFLKELRPQRTKKKLPRNILNKDEIRKLLDVCDNQRDRALVFVTFDSGGRASEVLNMRVGDVEFDEVGGATLRLGSPTDESEGGKTGEGMVYVYECVPDLKLWLSMIPDKSTNTPLWPSRKTKKALKIGRFEELLEKLGKAAGIEKHISPHVLRHSSATFYSTILTDSQMRVRYRWAKDSKMPSVYQHLSGQHVKDSILKFYGIKMEKSQNVLAPQKCVWCGCVNPPSARFCRNCNTPLDSEGARKAAEKTRKRRELVETFIAKLSEESPSIADGIFRELREKMEALE